MYISVEATVGNDDDDDDTQARIRGCFPLHKRHITCSYHKGQRCSRSVTIETASFRWEKCPNKQTVLLLWLKSEGSEVGKKCAAEYTNKK